ncbi:Histone RNA hairpin-binding protein [Trypanosoma melophagium]|uniref:Histone RNA hairpin-binding protein n=1 Tax=Trypanosoma melophagium TaxID=715481 RepID=UPI00351A0AA8|nr:Histone RNA hairpin-binding protein [Trypanosoma melophagium]
MMPVAYDENNRRVAPNSGHAGVSSRECSLGRNTMKNDASAAPTPIRNAPAAATAATGNSISVHLSRSPVSTTHHPYGVVPLSAFGPDSELEGYASNEAENVVTVRPSYKTNLSQTPSCTTSGISTFFVRRTSQRSPITVPDKAESHLRNHPTGVLGASMPTSSTTPCGGMNNNANMGSVVAPPQQPPVVSATTNAIITAAAGGVVGGTRIGSNRMTPTIDTNRRVVSLDAAERHGGGGGLYQCPASFLLVMAEEKHLHYTGVELPLSELNTGDTAERARRLQQRQRQVQYGKETTGYSNYIRAVPSRGDREFRNPMHPVTPRPEYNCSKRTFDRYLNVWRRQLHLWDEYDPNNVAPQYTRIGIPTLSRLGLEPPPSTPDGQQSALPSSFTPLATHLGSGSACTPVMPRGGRRDIFISSASHQRQMAYTTEGNAGFVAAAAGGGGAVGACCCGAPGVPPHATNNMGHMRPSSGCCGGSWSITNTPHTPFHGSTHSNSSHPPPLVSVLAQRPISSPFCADSSNQSSPNPYGGLRNSSGWYHATGVGGSTSSVSAAAAAAMGGGCGSSSQNISGANFNAWEGGIYGCNSNQNCYASRGHYSPSGVHRHTPHSTPNHYQQHYYYGATGGNFQGGGSCGNMMNSSSPTCVCQETWGNSQRQQY